MISGIFFTFLQPALIFVAGGNDAQSETQTRDIPTRKPGINVNTAVFNSTTDGFHLWDIKFYSRLGNPFGQRMYLQKRTYDPQNITFNNTICLSALQWSWDNTSHKITSMFSVRPDGSGPLVASMVMNFSYDNKSQGYNIMRSAPYIPFEEEDEEVEEAKEAEEKEEEKEGDEPVYKLPPPQWNFLYTLENCTVVQPVDIASGAEDRSDTLSEGHEPSKPHCELWDIFSDNQSSKCRDFFDCYCNTSKVTIVNLADLCWGWFEETNDESQGEGGGEEEEEGKEEKEEEDEEDGEDGDGDDEDDEKANDAYDASADNKAKKKEEGDDDDD